jgi:hypothetical protein
MTITVTSSLFDEGGTIPASAAHTYAGGQNVSPDLSWSGLPPGTQSVALTCWDPDAPTTVGFSHWVVAGLAADSTGLPAGAGAAGKNPAGSILGFTDWGESRYGGMAPPPGDDPHHYQFTVWALDTADAGIDAVTTYAKFRFMIRGHVLDSATLTGRFGT